MGLRSHKLTSCDISSPCECHQNSQEHVGRIRLGVLSDAKTAASRMPVSGSHLRARSRCDPPVRRRPFRPPLDARLRAMGRARHQASPGTAPSLKSQRRVWPTGAGRRPWRPAAGRPSGLAGAPVGAGAVALRPTRGRSNSVARRRTWSEPPLLKLALARVRGRSCHGEVAQVGGDRRRSEPSLGCALTWGSLRRRTPRSALAYTPKRAPNAGASGAGRASAPLDLPPAQPSVIGVPSYWGVCSGAYFGERDR